MSISRSISAPTGFVRLAVALALATGLTFVIGSGSPASAATECTVTKATVTQTSARLTEIRERRAKVIKRLGVDQRRVARLERSIRSHRTPAKVRALRAAKAEVRVERGRLTTLNERAVPARKKVLAARVAHQLCMSESPSEIELFDLLDTLGLTPLLEMLGLPQLLVELGVVDLLEMLGLADILEDLGLGSLIGR
ncbi:hypothetical protein ACFQ0K_13310 [Nocardioides caeni]|uniref:Uncharacterized protein n=1 Tax=Nocardioides caeni TaxID=574700 RepID=A0A4S8NLY3_9ACTN|nr:hypothetical protein [Nocardioides caeni]THV17615.1 hypothetical protein E9934_03795 [Nocardioides caeni]